MRSANQPVLRPRGLSPACHAPFGEVPWSAILPRSGGRGGERAGADATAGVGGVGGNGDPGADAEAVGQMVAGGAAHHELLHRLAGPARPAGRSGDAAVLAGGADPTQVDLLHSKPRRPGAAPNPDDRVRCDPTQVGAVRRRPGVRPDPGWGRAPTTGCGALACTTVAGCGGSSFPCTVAGCGHCALPCTTFAGCGAVACTTVAGCGASTLPCTTVAGCGARGATVAGCGGRPLGPWPPLPLCGPCPVFCGLP